jgi:hypothetical protein
MKIIFIITEIYNGRKNPLLKEFDTYEDAQNALEKLHPGRFQIEKIFVKEQ